MIEQGQMLSFYSSLVNGIAEKISNILKEASEKYYKPNYDEIVKTIIKDIRTQENKSEAIGKIANDIFILSDTVTRIELTLNKFEKLSSEDPTVSKILQEKEKTMSALAILSKVAEELIDEKIIKEEEFAYKMANEISQAISGYSIEEAQTLIELLEIKYHVSLSSGVLYALSMINLANMLGYDIKFVSIAEAQAKDTAAVAFRENAFDTFAFCFGQSVAYAAFIYDAGLTYLATRADKEINHMAASFVNTFTLSPNTYTSRYLLSQQAQAQDQTR
ncbi:MAG: hypothetical protein QXS19_08050 [Candidatus Methanomethylicia archaeon]